MAEGPAVAYPNATVAAGGGSRDGDASGLVFGSATIPLGQSYGAEGRGLLGGTGGDVRWGVGGDLFWRDPDTGMLGVHQSLTGWDSDVMGRTDIKGELFTGQYTTSARAGFQYGDVDDGFFGRIDLRWYATDDFMLSGGGELESGDFVARFKTEYQPGMEAFPGLSVFADAEIGTGGRSLIFAGLRVYLGGEVKTLIRRHREDELGPNEKSDPEAGGDDDDGKDKDHED